MLDILCNIDEKLSKETLRRLNRAEYYLLRK